MRSILLSLLLSSGIAAAAPDPVPAPEVTPSTVKLDIPQVPKFELPESANGIHGTKELRVNGTALLDSEIKVKGYVVWVYDCVTANMRAGQTRAQVQKRVDDDPTICERMKLYLADTADAPADSALWVVDVPRAPNKMEQSHLPKAELAKWPEVPKVGKGDYVVVTGKFALASPHGDRNSDGLLVYKSVERVTPSSAPVKLVELAQPPPRDLKAPAAPAKKQVAAKVQNESADHLTKANQLARDAKLDDAIAEYTAATASWPGNHQAFYGLGMMAVAKRDWAKAAQAFTTAAGMRPDAPAYLMWAGIAAYETAVAKAREEQAKKAGRKPEEIQVDLSTVNFETAESWLVPGVAAAPGMWRAHQYLGKIYRARHQVRAAAEQFTHAIEANPKEYAAYVALAQLYAQWEFVDNAIKVAEAGAQNTNDPDVWFVLGLVAQRKNPDRAIEAFTKALELKPTLAIARYQRGSAAFWKKDYALAKQDLEAFLKSGDRDGFRVATANQLLLQIPAKR